MLTKDFYGKNGFVWWTGVIENSDDPLKLGSVQVRIIGLHSEDKSKVPTSDLPWAQVALPTNGSYTMSVPKPGDWVFGFFQDGDFAQIPVVMGVFPGIESVQSATIYNDVVIKKGSRNVPRPSQTDRVIGEPTTSRMSRGVYGGTLTEQLNNKLSHACDVSEAIKMAVQWAKVQNGTIVQSIVGTIKSLTEGLGSDPTGIVNQAINFLKKIKTFLRWIQDLLKEITAYAQIGIRYAKIARAIIDYVANLPNRIREFLKQCLTRILSGVFAIVGALFSTEGFDIGGDFTGLSNEFKSTINQLGSTTQSFVQTITLPGQFIEAIVNPSSQSAQAESGKILNDTISSITSNGEAINNQTLFNKQSARLP